MFTGLVDDVGTVREVSDTEAGRELRITCRYTDLLPGESVAVNGACLTVRSCGTGADGGWFTTAAVVTTLGRTTIGSWDVGRRLNLERALRVGDRLGGHMVLGHVDTVVAVRNTRVCDDAWLVDLALPASMAKLMVARGSITVDGVSLTVNELLDDDGVQLSLIEFTREHTTLGSLETGDTVHVEVDVLAKHVARLLAAHLNTDQQPHDYDHVNHVPQ
ncbi:MAG: riboflavin synthase [Gemmatimonadota bacterium]|nr:riboflavin synthase [Gemmatimonadota bacterium]